MGSNEIVNLLEQYREGRCKADDLLLLYVWLDQVAAKEEAAMPSDQDCEALRVEVWDEIMKKQQRSRSVRRYYAWSAAAASLLLLLAGWGYLYRHSIDPPLHVQMVTVSTGKGEVRSVQLPDSSLVWLNAGTTLVYPSTFGDSAREVKLQNGEAFFDTRPDPERPFIVRSNHLVTRVLGTAFKVRSFSKVPDQVAVSSGKVSVTAERHPQQYVLSASDRLVYNAATDSFRIDHVDEAEVNAWIHGDIIMTSASIQDVLTELEGLYDVRFISSKDLKRGRLSVFLRKDMSLELALEIVQTVSVQPDKVHFRKKGEGLYEVY